MQFRDKRVSNPSIADSRSIEELLDDQPLMDWALARARRTALLHHKLAGVPIVVWENGAIKYIPADQIVIPDVPYSPPGRTPT